ncbi:PEP-CTERM sorting domain-containing protein [Methanobrevibacter gottschalkii]|uniref:PEP-CTERM sorting domain-containing protein n=1 Tax=Methanobrevibacter gottschalkii TaxID=190974 RepID=UPI0038D1044B
MDFGLNLYNGVMYFEQIMLCSERITCEFQGAFPHDGFKIRYAFSRPLGAGSGFLPALPPPPRDAARVRGHSLNPIPIKINSFMKKSIIALALLSSAALADEIPTTTDITDPTQTSGNGTVSWNTTEVSSSLTTWAFSFTVSVNSSSTGTTTILSMTSGTNGNGDTIASGLGVKYDYTNTALTLSRANGTVLDSTNLLAVTSGATYTLAYDASTYTVYLGSSDGNYITYTFDASSTVTTTLTSTVLRHWTNGGNVSTTITSVADLSSVEGDSAAFASYVTTGSVPEPATATLGLLALGALALRRRRA